MTVTVVTVLYLQTPVKTQYAGRTGRVGREDRSDDNMVLTSEYVVGGGGGGSDHAIQRQSDELMY